MDNKIPIRQSYYIDTDGQEKPCYNITPASAVFTSDGKTVELAIKDAANSVDSVVEGILNDEDIKKELTDKLVEKLDKMSVSGIYATEQDGVYFCDAEGYVIASFTDEGFSICKLTDQAVTYIKSVIGTGGSIDDQQLSSITEELSKIKRALPTSSVDEGFYVADEAGNVVFGVSPDGVTDWVKTNSTSGLNYTVIKTI